MMDQLRQRLLCCAQVNLLLLSIHQATPQLINIQSAEGIQRKTRQKEQPLAPPRGRRGSLFSCFMASADCPEASPALTLHPGEKSVLVCVANEAWSRWCRGMKMMEQRGAR